MEKDNKQTMKEVKAGLQSRVKEFVEYIKQMATRERIMSMVAVGCVALGLITVIKSEKRRIVNEAVMGNSQGDYIIDNPVDDLRVMCEADPQADIVGVAIPRDRGAVIDYGTANGESCSVIIPWSAAYGQADILFATGGDTRKCVNTFSSRGGSPPTDPHYSSWIIRPDVTGPTCKRSIKYNPIAIFMDSDGKTNGGNPVRVEMKCLNNQPPEISELSRRIIEMGCFDKYHLSSPKLEEKSEPFNVYTIKK